MKEVVKRLPEASTGLKLVKHRTETVKATTAEPPESVFRLEFSGHADKA